MFLNNLFTTFVKNNGMKKIRRKEILEMMLQNLKNMKWNGYDAYFLCWILDDLLDYKKITDEEREQMIAYIFTHKPKYDSKLMCPVAKRDYGTRERYSRINEIELIWNEDNYDQRKAWLKLHIDKNS